MSTSVLIAAKYYTTNPVPIHTRSHLYVAMRYKHSKYLKGFDSVILVHGLLPIFYELLQQYRRDRKGVTKSAAVRTNKASYQSR